MELEILGTGYINTLSLILSTETTLLLSSPRVTFTSEGALAYFERMNKMLLFALSVIVLGLGGNFPLKAECGHCETDAVAEKASGDESAKKESPDVPAAQGQKTLEDRITGLEECLKDVGSCDTAGSPYPGKSKNYSKKKECPKEKCPEGTCARKKSS